MEKFTQHIRQSFAEQLKKARIAKGFSYSEVANAVNMTTQNYSRFERGLQSIPHEKLTLLAQMLDVSIDALFLLADKTGITTQVEDDLISRHRTLSKAQKNSVERIMYSISITDPSPEFLNSLADLIKTQKKS